MLKNHFIHWYYFKIDLNPKYALENLLRVKSISNQCFLNLKNVELL